MNYQQLHTFQAPVSSETLTMFTNISRRRPNFFCLQSKVLLFFFSTGLDKSLRTSPDTVLQSEPQIFLKTVDSSCELATYVSPSPHGKKTLSPAKLFYAYNCSILWWETKKGVVCGETQPFEWSSKTIPKKLAGVLHDHSSYYWRTFPPGPFAMWNGNWMAELVLFGEPAMRADWAGFGWLVPLTPMLHCYLAAP